MPPRGTCAPCRPPLASLDAPPGRPMPTRGLVGCTTCKKYMSVLGGLIRLELHVYMYRLSTQKDMSFSTIAQWENSFPLNALVPCSIPTQAASGRRPEVDETEYWRKASSKEVGHLAPEPFYSFSSSSSFWSPLRLSSLRLAFASFLRLAFAPLIFASRLCAPLIFASRLHGSPFAPRGLRLAALPSRSPF